MLILHYPRLFAMPFEENQVNFFKTTYFSTAQTIWSWPSVVRATRCFLTFLGLPMHRENNYVQKCSNFTLRMTIGHAIQRKTREFFEDDLFLGGSNYLVLAFHSRCDKVFFNGLGFPMHRQNNLVQKCSNFTLHTTICHSVRRKTRAFFEDELFLCGSYY